MSTYDLIDTGESFSIRHNNVNIFLPYGNLSLALTNINIDELNDFLIEKGEMDFLLRFREEIYQLNTAYYKSIEEASPADGFIIDSPSAIFSNRQPIMNISNPKVGHLLTHLYALRKKIIHLLKNSYLNDDQLQVLADALIDEYSDKLRNIRHQYSLAVDCLPFVLRSVETRSQIRSILLDPSCYFSGESLEKVKNFQISFTVEKVNPYGVQKVYHLSDFSSFFILDIQQFILKKIKVLKCQNPKCERLFIPTSGKNKKYCSLPHKDTSATCAKLMHDNPTDEFAKLRKTARGRQDRLYLNAVRDQDTTNPKYIYNKDAIEQLYQEWKDNLRVRYIEYKEMNDLKGFQDWIEKNYFRKDVLTALGVKYLNPKWQKKKKT